MRHLSTPSFCGHTPPRKRPIFRAFCATALVIFTLLILIVVPLAQAASTGQGPRPLTPATSQAIRQALKKQIHVRHTGKPSKTTPKKIKHSYTSPTVPYNNIGISDATNRATASFDGHGYSYDAQALQDAGLAPGINVTSQNITYIWPNVATGVPDNYQVAGQVIPVSSLAGATTVGFLGAATNGPCSGTATLTYTDGTTQTFTLGLTDWWSGSIQYGNQLVAQFTTINTRFGTRSGAYYLYSTTTSLQAGKTLQSVTLPATVSQGHMHIFAIGVSGPTFNNTGISDDSNPSAGSFDGSGSGNHSYSTQALQGVDLVAGQQFDSDGIAYAWPSAGAGTPDNYQANGQILPVIPVANATTLGILGAASNGNSSGTATMTFTDGTSQTFTLGLSDWTLSPSFGNAIAATMSYRNASTGKQTITTYLFTAEVAIPPGETLQSVTLPTTVSGGQQHIFALGTRSVLNNLGTSNDSQPGEGSYDGWGKSWSIQALEAAKITPGQPLIFNGVNFTWPASYGAIADNYQAAGQTISVTPVPNATTLAFLGSATNGPSNGTATITYTDSTTQTFTLGLTDWWSGTPQYGNQIVATFSTINSPSGPRPGSYYLYYTETNLQAGKTIQSVTLPTTVSTGHIHIISIGTRSAYNNIGISDDSYPSGANFDQSGNSYSEQVFEDPNGTGWNPGDTLTYSGIDFIWPNVSAGQGDNYVAQGQTIPVTPVAGATTIGFVGAASNGGNTGSSGTATLTYTDNTTQTFTLGMSDWALHGGQAAPLASNRLFALLPSRNTPKGPQTINIYLFYMETTLQSGKTLQSVTFPSSVNQGQLHIFMMGTRAGENYPNNVGTSDDSDTLFANYDGNGASYSIQALEAAGLNEGQPFTFNGVTFTWPASYSVIPDNYQEGGQVIPVTPVTGATTLAFLGSATNTGPNGGTSSSGTATITYTDTSTQTFTLTLTDWWNTMPQGGNIIAATCSYINKSSGPLNQRVHVYYASVPLQTSKTIQSVTLPTTVSTGQMHIFAIGTKAGNDVRSISASDTTTYQLRSDGTLWRYTGTPMTGWQELGNNPATTQIAVSANDTLYQLHADGSIWKYTGTPLTGWQELDNNPAAVAIVASNSNLYQLHSDGTIWKYTGPPMTGWQKLDNNTATTQIVVDANDDLYQFHNDGTIWKYTGTPMTGWQELDNNPDAIAIAASNSNLYQFHNDGTLWRYTGTPMTGWQEIDNNPATTLIAVSANDNLYEQRADGSIWHYTGTPMTGWQEIDNHPATVAIVANSSTLYELRNDGTLWQYTGTPLTGWQQLA